MPFELPRGYKPEIPQSEKGFGRGNITAGADRVGNAGRPAVFPPGTVKHQLLITLSDRQCALAVHLGEGSASEGVRIALERIEPDPKWILDTLNARFIWSLRKEEERKLKAAAPKKKPGRPKKPISHGPRPEDAARDKRYLDTGHCDVHTRFEVECMECRDAREVQTIAEDLEDWAGLPEDWDDTDE